MEPAFSHIIDCGNFISMYPLGEVQEETCNESGSRRGADACEERDSSAETFSSRINVEKVYIEVLIKNHQIYYASLLGNYCS